MSDSVLDEFRERAEKAENELKRLEQRITMLDSRLDAQDNELDIDVTLNKAHNLNSQLDERKDTEPFNQNEAEQYIQSKINDIKQLNQKNDLKKLGTLLNELLGELYKYKLTIDDSNKWQAFIDYVHSNHSELLSICHQDPFCKRAFDKPRGYSGDAVTMDMIYSKQHNTPNISQLGQNIFNYMTKSLSTAATVRERAQFIATFIDNLYKNTKSDLNVLSVACGHLRELETCRPFWSLGAINVVAFDQDQQSLDQIKTDYIDNGYDNVTVLQGKVKYLFSSDYCNKTVLKANGNKKFDLVWSAGLYDYLKDETAQTLTQNLFNLVKSNGRLLIANLFPTQSCGFMEMFANWRLIYRDMQQIKEFMSKINKDQIADVKEHVLEEVGFIELTRK